VKSVQNPRASISPARAAAFEILLRVERESSYASELLRSRPNAALSGPDHALATELVMGVLRWRLFLDSAISLHSSQALPKLDLEILIALRLGVYQLMFLSRIPARSAAAFVNAVLRKIASQSLSPPTVDYSSAEALAVTTAHPQWMVDRWSNSYGFATAKQICRYDQSLPVTAVRMRHPDAEGRLRAEGIELSPGSMLASARRVMTGEITKTSAFKEGMCVIQDEASQLVAHLVGDGKSFLDCCAAPGGKTLLLADRNPNAHVTAVELHPHRARLLRQLLRQSTRADDGNIGVITADARTLPFATHFDRILADVPCSGTGTLARNPEIKWRLVREDFANLQARQLAILRGAMQRTAPGGRVVYSTCSLEREENEEVIDRALAKDSSFNIFDCRNRLERLHAEQELIASDFSSLLSGPFLRTLPGIHPCDGFFAAILEKQR
jgi:16S rRNA (cytosine967-C5)-methyltransferase